MLSKINYKALILVVLLFLTAVLVGGIFVYSIFFISFFLIVLSYYSGNHSSKNLVNIVWKSSDKIQVGNRLSLSMELYNSGIFPIPYLKVKTNLVKKLTGEDEKTNIYSLMTSEKTVIEKDFLCKNKGIYEIGYIEAEFGDALGIFNWRKVFNTNILLYVYPKIHVLKSFALPLRQHFGTTAVRHNAYEDFASIKDIRKYEYGDSLKKIHWKVTAHKGDFHVKNVDLNATADINIFLDLDQNSYNGEFIDDMEELAAECAVSIARYALIKNMAVSFIARGNSYIRVTGTGISRLPEIIDAVTKAENNGNTPIWELVRHEGQKLNLGATGILITPNMNDLLLETLLSFQAKGISFVVIYLCEDRNNKNENAEALQQQGIRVYTVGLQDDIVQVLGGHYER